ncbi:MAG: hypothetical protein GKR92_07505 [Gammaproteobacteria bacterium]|nr:MAG: hypothetical protein GKR92_07505 [Gammaproteobacteria bacterium]
MNLVGVRSCFMVGTVKIFFVLSILLSSLYFSQALACPWCPPPPPTPTLQSISPSSGTYEGSVTVSIVGSPYVRYSTNGFTPNSNSPRYTGPFTITSSTTVKARAYRINNCGAPGCGTGQSIWGGSATVNYTIDTDVATPTITPNGGSFANNVTISLSSPTSGAQLHYTTNGSAPTSASPLYTGSIDLISSTHLKVIAVKNGLNDSEVVTAEFNINGQLAAPTITPNGGTHNGSVQVQLYSPDPGADIRYTIDNTIPDSNSPLFSSPFTLSTAGTTTVKAVSVSNGYSSSNISSRVFTIESSNQACTADNGSPASSRITVPSESDASVGAIAGQHSVGTTGVSTYSIPLSVLPGTAGVEPKLSLEYMSGSGNSIFGLGFQLSGLSSIARCGTTIVDDGAFGAADLDADDKFCIDGARLVAVNGGTYGAPDTEYRTQINSFNKIVSLGTTGIGPEKFQVWTKSGEILEYGFTSDSKITINSDVVNWSLNKLSDTKGNSLNVIYNYDASTHEQKPFRIEYTENDSASLSANQFVEFVYESRTDDVSSIAGTTVLSTNERVSQIKIGEGFTDRKLYKFTYKDPYTDASLLEQVDECYLDASQAEHCVRPTKFEWEESTGDLQLGASQDWSPSNTRNIEHSLVGDVNGDGLDDWVYFERPADSPNGHPHYGSPTNIYMRHSTGSSFGPEIQIATYTPSCKCTLSNGHIGCQDTVCNFDGYTHLIDINGDNKKDFLLENTIRISNGSDFQPAQTYSGNYTHDFSDVGDFNGDGYEDIVYKNGLGLYLHASDGTNLASISYIDALFQYPGKTKVFAADYSGDGRDDILTYYEISGQTTLWNSRLSRGDVSFNEVPFYADGIYADSNVIHFKDISANGVDDYIRVSGNGGSTQRYNGAPGGGGSNYPLNKTFNAPITIRKGSGLAIGSSVSLGSYSVTQYCDIPYFNSLPFGGTEWGGYKCPNASVGVGDVNGDAIADVVMFDETGFSGASVRITETPTPTIIKKITEGYAGNGEGKSIVFNYATLDDPNVYTPGTGAVFPNHDLSASVHGSVVSNVLVDNGIGGQLSTSYKYKHCRVNFHGHGNLGFEEVIEIDDATGIQTITYSKQEYPHIGEVYKTETKLPSGDLLSVSEVLEFDIKGTLGTEGSYGDGDPIYPYVKKQTERTYDLLDHQLITTVTTETTLDDYGNALTVLVTTTDAESGNEYTTSTASLYDNIENDPEKWHLGRLTQATVTKTGGVADPTDGSPPNDTRVSAFTYASDTGFLLTETIEPGPNALTKTYIHDDYGNRKQVETTGAGLVGTRITKTTYDANGRFPVYAENAMGPTHSETREYNNPWGGVTKLTGPNGLDTIWQYDAQGRKIREIRSDGTETNIYYNWCNSACEDPNAVFKVTTTSTAGATSVAYFDKLGRDILKESESFNGASVYVATDYDYLGRTKKVYQPYSDISGGPGAFTEYHYDLLDRVKQEDSPVTGTTTSDYDGLSVLITAVNANGEGEAKDQETIEVKNGLGWTLSTTDNGLNTDVGVPGDTIFQYDSYGNLRFVTDEHSNITENRYTIRGFKRYMDDPDMGVWLYEYNVLGELTQQTDAKLKVVDMKYDVLGRLYERNEFEGQSTWTYDCNADSTSSYQGIGKLCADGQDVGLSRSYSFDSLGRPTETATTIGGITYTASVSYDSVGRVDINTYPESGPGNSFQTQNIYNAVGFLEKVREAKGSCINYWQALAANDYGSISLETLGNNVMTARSYSQSTGRINSIYSDGGFLQNLTYVWDDVGNLKQRNDLEQNFTENFLYDGLNRLKSAEFIGVGATTKTFTYDSIGNIKTKSDVEAGATYNYGTRNIIGSVDAGPHAVTSVGSKTYVYDDNGNMISGDGRTIEWSSYNKPISITKNGSESEFKYGPSRARYEQNLIEGGVTTTTYLGGMEKVEKSDTSVTEYKHFISAGGNTIAIYTHRSNNTNDTRYLHRDHLGSIDVITDENKVEVDRLSYDAFGKRRLANWNDGIPTIASNNTRGFTGHEMLDAVGIIHMNGRVYDPTLGRFLSADPNVQAPKNMQSLNRYSYVLNNPLSYTDPSGFFFKSLFKKIKRAIRRLVRSIVRAIADFIKKYGRTIVSIALVAIPIPGVNVYVAAFASGLVASGGDLKAGLVSALTAGAFNQVGGYFNYLEGGNAVTGLANGLTKGQQALKTLAHGAVGGVSSVVSGGKFGEGFAAAGVTQVFSKQVGGIDSGNRGFSTQRTIAASIVGGTASAVSGGKFANGAVTGAFSRAFNDEAHSGGFSPTSGEFETYDGQVVSLTVYSAEGGFTYLADGDFNIYQFDYRTGYVERALFSGSAESVCPECYLIGGTGAIRGFARGGEIAFSKNFRIAPFGNRTGNAIGRFPHYHRRGINVLTGKTKPGQGIGRHRPWEKKATDKGFGDRF